MSKKVLKFLSIAFACSIAILWMVIFTYPKTVIEVIEVEVPKIVVHYEKVECKKLNPQICEFSFSYIAVKNSMDFKIGDIFTSEISSSMKPLFCKKATEYQKERGQDYDGDVRCLSLGEIEDSGFFKAK